MEWFRDVENVKGMVHGVKCDRNASKATCIMKVIIHVRMVYRLLKMFWGWFKVVFDFLNDLATVQRVRNCHRIRNGSKFIKNVLGTFQCQCSRT